MSAPDGSNLGDTIRARLRALPAVGEIMAGEEGRALRDAYGEGLVKWELRRVLESARAAIHDGGPAHDREALLASLRARLRRLADPLGRRAINATGTLLHTGLGRAPLPRKAIEALTASARHTILQTSLETGARNLREEKIEPMLQALTGCEAATVVNNNAAATMLVIHTLCAGRETVVSRGQLIEIGGAFRMPDVMAMSNTVLREVGTTNRTHLRDYAEAIGEATGALIHIHTSNYRVRGFQGTPDIRALAALGRERGVPVIDDLGSGALVSLTPWGLPDEPLVADSLKAGAEVACFSGDKLIGGPQCGIIVGRRAVIQRIRKNPFARMFRVDKLRLAALEATLPHFLDDSYRVEIPFYQMLARDEAELEAMARGIVAAVEPAARAAGAAVAIRPDHAYVGSGSIPDEGIPSRVVAVTPSAPQTLADLARRLRGGLPSVFGRIHDGALLLDMRSLLREDPPDLAEALRAALQEA